MREALPATVTRGRRKQGWLSRAGGAVSKEVIGKKRFWIFKPKKGLSQAQETKEKLFLIHKLLAIRLDVVLGGWLGQLSMLCPKTSLQYGTSHALELHSTPHLRSHTSHWKAEEGLLHPWLLPQGPELKVKDFSQDDGKRGAPPTAVYCPWGHYKNKMQTVCACIWTVQSPQSMASWKPYKFCDLGDVPQKNSQTVEYPGCCVHLMAPISLAFIPGWPIKPSLLQFVYSLGEWSSAWKWPLYPMISILLSRLSLDWREGLLTERLRPWETKADHTRQSSGWACVGLGWRLELAFTELGTGITLATFTKKATGQKSACSSE